MGVRTLGQGFLFAYAYILVQYPRTLSDATELKIILERCSQICPPDAFSLFENVPLRKSE